MTKDRKLYPQRNPRLLGRSGFDCFWASGCSDSARCDAHGSCVAAAQSGGQMFTGEHMKTEVVSSKTMTMRERIASRVVQNVCELPDYTSPDDQPDLVMCTVQELEACVLRAFEEIEECSGVETTADQPPKKADLSSELFAAWNALNELRRDAEEAEARAFKALDGYEVPPEEPKADHYCECGHAERFHTECRECLECFEFKPKQVKANCLCPPGGYYTGCPQHGNLKKAAEPLEKHPDYCMAHGGHLVDSPACKLAREREKRA